jgi:hypothetical protein
MEGNPMSHAVQSSLRHLGSDLNQVEKSENQVMEPRPDQPTERSLEMLMPEPSIFSEEDEYFCHEI